MKMGWAVESTGWQDYNSFRVTASIMVTEILHACAIQLLCLISMQMALYEVII